MAFGLGQGPWHSSNTKIPQFKNSNKSKCIEWPVATTNGHGHWPWAWAQDLEALGQDIKYSWGARGVSLRAAKSLLTRG